MVVPPYVKMLTTSVHCTVQKHSVQPAIEIARKNSAPPAMTTGR